MFREPWFRFLAWSTALFFFFVAFMALACILGPPSNQGQISLWMSGMEKAMEESLMSIAMHAHGFSILQYNSLKLIPTVVIAGALLGLYAAIKGLNHEK